MILGVVQQIILQRQKHVRRVCRDDESLLRLSVRGEKKKRVVVVAFVVVVAAAAVLFFREEECADLYIGRRKTASIRFG